MNIGLFGGTFNPIHRCHLTVARQTLTRLALDRILFIPSGDPPHKPPGSLAPARDRVEMVRLALSGEPGFELSEVEVRRSGHSYSVDSVRVLRRELGPDCALYLMIGLDAFLDYPSWREAATLLTLCHFIVLSRPGSSFGHLADLPPLPRIDQTALHALDDGSRDILEVSLPAGNTRLILLTLPPCEASASEIRQRIQSGQRLANLLPPLVESYIIRHRLYVEEPDRTGI